jgi:hypothetical protein
MSWTPILGCAMRVIALESNGTPMIGPNTGYVSHCFVGVTLSTSESSRGEEWRQRKVNGTYTPHQLDRPPLQGEIALEIIGAHKTLFDIISGMSPSGEGFDVLATPPPRSFSIEIWTKKWEDHAMTSELDLLVVPWAMNATWAGARVEQGRMKFDFVATCQPNEHWLTGPFDSTPELIGAMSLASLQPTMTTVPPEGPINVTEPPAYLIPSVGTVTTPDPGLLPAQCTFVVHADREGDGPDAGFGGFVNQYSGGTGATAWTLYEQSRWTYFQTDPAAPRAINYQVSETESTFAVAVDTVTSGHPCQAFTKVGDVWTPGTVMTGAAIVVESAAGQPVTIGATDTAAWGRFNGRIYSVELRTGLDPAVGTMGRYLTPTTGLASTPDPGPMPNEFTMLAKILAAPYSVPGAEGDIACQMGAAGDYGFRFRIFENLQRYVQIQPTADGTTILDGPFFPLAEFGDGTYVGMSMQANDGAGHLAVQPYTSTDGITWMPTRAVDTSMTALTGFHDSAAPVRIGTWFGGNSNFDGRIYSVEMRTGLDPGARYLSPLTSAAYYPDTPDATITTDTVITAKVRKTLLDSSSYATVVAHMGTGAANTYGWRLWVPLGGGLAWGESPDGSLTMNDQTLMTAAEMAAAFNDNEDFYIGVKVNYGATTHTVQAITSTDGGTWTNIGTARTFAAGPFDATARMLIGAQGDGGQHRWDGRVYWAQRRTGLDPTGTAPRYLAPRSVAVSPDAPDLTIGSERVRLTVRLSADVFSATFPTILGKFGPEGREYLMYGYSGNVINGSVGSLAAPGNIDFSIYPSAPVGVPLTMASEFQHGSDQITVTLDDGSHYTATLPSAAHILNTSGELYIGSLDGASSFRIYWAQLERLDASGNVAGLVWRFDANEAPTDATTTSWTDPRGRTWTVNSAAAISGRTLWKFNAADAPTDATTTTWTDPRGRAWTVTNPQAISGRTLWKFDANEAPTDATTTTWTDSRGRTWTLTDPAVISGRTMWKFDAEDYPGTGTVYTDPRGRAWTLTDAAAIAKSYR